MGNAVKHFAAERREPSGELMPQTHRRACAQPLQRPRFEGGKCFAVLPNGVAQIHAIRTRERRTTIGSALSGLNIQAGSQTLGDAGVALADMLMASVGRITNVDSGPDDLHP